MTVPPHYPPQPPFHDHPGRYPQRPPHKKTNALVLWVAGGSVGMCLLWLTVLGAGVSDSANRVAASSTSRVAPVGPGAPAKTTPKPA
ncbi:hypothetical protein [Nocardia thailandica]|uniref:hypothetical protein n=1 Tax=Nocardia thailandica TaxID=257275 RepID=UPI0002EBF53E|nr:hypothetical protein [Nocardia thailandica]